MDVAKGESWFECMPTRFSWLSGLAKSFDRYRFISCAVEYKAAVGTVESGLVTFGPDWDASAKDVTYKRNMVMALTPICEGPVWQSSRLALPPSRLQTRREYRLMASSDSRTEDQAFDVMPCTIAYSCSGSKAITYGELWVEYDVELFGTSLSA